MGASMSIGSGDQADLVVYGTNKSRSFEVLIEEENVACSSIVFNIDNLRVRMFMAPEHMKELAKTITNALCQNTSAS